VDEEETINVVVHVHRNLLALFTHAENFNLHQREIHNLPNIQLVNLELNLISKVAAYKLPQISDKAYAEIITSIRGHSKNSSHVEVHTEMLNHQL
jgi:hypothetical protein